MVFLFAFALLYPWVTGIHSRGSNEFKFYALLVFSAPLTLLLLASHLRKVGRGSLPRGLRLAILAGSILGIYSIILCGLAVEAFAILFLLPALLVILSHSGSGQHRLHPSMLRVLIPLVLLVIASCFLTRFQYVALMGDPYRRTGLVTFLCCLVLFFSALDYLRNPDHPRRLIDLLLVASLPVCLLALWQFFHLEGGIRNMFTDLRVDPRPIGTFGHTNWFGTYLLILLPYALERALGRKGGWWSFLCLLVYATILAAQTRGAWVATLVILVFVGWVRRSLWRSLLKLALGILVITGFLGGWHDGRILRRGASFGDEANRALEMSSTAGSSRFGYWKYAMERMPRRILLGSGLDTFAERQPDDPPAPNTKAHSIYLEYGVTIGVVATGLYLIFIWKCFAARTRLDSGWAAYAVFLGYSIQGIFIHDTIQTWPLIWLLAGAAAAQASGPSTEIGPQQEAGKLPDATTPS